jgi:hypothetical protein
MRAVFSPKRKADFVLSLGTGSSRYDTTDMTKPEALKKRGALSRLFQLMRERTRERIIGRAFEDNSNVHRVDLELDGEEPRLDDTSRMRELKEVVQNDSSLTLKIMSLAQKMIASLFYFELENMPTRMNGVVTCTGSIFCFLNHQSPAYPVLMRQILEGPACFFLNSQPVSNTHNEIEHSRDSGVFRIRISVITNNFSISLRTPTSKSEISGSPFVVDKLITAQGLDAYFGRSDHKRKRSLEDPTNFNKRRRIEWGCKFG